MVNFYKSAYLHVINKDAKKSDHFIKFKIAPEPLLDESAESTLWFTITSGLFTAGFHTSVRDAEKLIDILDQAIKISKGSN